MSDNQFHWVQAERVKTVSSLRVGQSITLIRGGQHAANIFRVHSLLEHRDDHEPRSPLVGTSQAHQVMRRGEMRVTRDSRGDGNVQ